MVQPLLNHIQGKNGRRWTDLIRKIGGENILLVAVDAAKYLHKAIICNFYGDIEYCGRFLPCIAGQCTRPCGLVYQLFEKGMNKNL